MKSISLLFLGCLLTSCVTETVTGNDGSVTTTRRLDLPAFLAGTQAVKEVLPLITSPSGK